MSLREVPSRVSELLSLPEEPTLSVRRELEPERHALAMRLLWLAASMKNCDVIVALLPSDAQCLELAAIVSQMGGLLTAVRKKEQEGTPPQLIVALRDQSEASLLDEMRLEPKPLVVTPELTLPALICEVLHPNAHWTGSLDGVTSRSGSQRDSWPHSRDSRPRSRDSRCSFSSVVSHASAGGEGATARRSRPPHAPTASFAGAAPRAPYRAPHRTLDAEDPDAMTSDGEDLDEDVASRQYRR